MTTEPKPDAAPIPAPPPKARRREGAGPISEPWRVKIQLTRDGIFSKPAGERP